VIKPMPPSILRHQGCQACTVSRNVGAPEWNNYNKQCKSNMPRELNLAWNSIFVYAATLAKEISHGKQLLPWLHGKNERLVVNRANYHLDLSRMSWYNRHTEVQVTCGEKFWRCFILFPFFWTPIYSAIIFCFASHIMIFFFVE
jgi:hypothetical protein